MERHIADMTLRILEDRRTPERREEPPDPGRRRMPFDPVMDSINAAAAVEPYGKPRSASSASQQDPKDSLRTALLRSNTDTEGRRLLNTLPIRRAWKGPAISKSATDDDVAAAVLEAVMVYERGQVQHPGQQCSRCRRGQGLLPECIKIDNFRDGTCSNCLISRASPPQTKANTSREFSPARRFISASVPASTSREDIAAVWKVIAGVLATQPDDCRLDDVDQAAAAPARRIEDAALLVARSADEWGHAVEDGEDRSRRRTESERIKLATQASRIRDTALRIAECARKWGEKQLAATARASP